MFIRRFLQGNKIAPIKIDNGGNYAHAQDSYAYLTSIKIRSLYISLPLIFASLESKLLPLIFAPLIDLLFFAPLIDLKESFKELMRFKMVVP